MIQGLPSLFEYVVGMVTGDERRDSLAVVLYHLLGDVVNAVEYALNHYFPLTLAESFLQNSSIGTPYHKWAKFTNEDFRRVDECLRRLVPAVWSWYAETVDGSYRGKWGAMKEAWNWFYIIKEEYTCCMIDPGEPALTLAVLNLDGWVESAGGPFRSVWTQAPWEPPVPVPPVVTKVVWDIADRAVIGDLRRAGRARLDELRAAHQSLALWLRANYTMEQVTALHGGTLSEGLLG